MAKRASPKAARKRAVAPSIANDQLRRIGDTLEMWELSEVGDIASKVETVSEKLDKVIELLKEIAAQGREVEGEDY